MEGKEPNNKHDDAQPERSLAHNSLLYVLPPLTGLRSVVQDIIVSVGMGERPSLAFIPR
jgi:hypothetical protein